VSNVSSLEFIVLELFNAFCSATAPQFFKTFVTSLTLGYNYHFIFSLQTIHSLQLQARKQAWNNNRDYCRGYAPRKGWSTGWSVGWFCWIQI